MRRLEALILSVVIVIVGSGLSAGAKAQNGYPVPPPNYGAPMLSASDIDAISSILGTISSPSRRDTLAENWLQFARQTITKSLEQNQQWLNIQKMQAQNQGDSDQLQAELVKMQLEIERLRQANLAMENENLKLRLQLQQQLGQTPSAVTPRLPQAP